MSTFLVPGAGLKKKKNWYKRGGSKQHRLIILQSRGHKYKICFAKFKVLARLPPPGVSRGKSVSLLFPASGGHLCSLTPGPFPVLVQLFASVISHIYSFLWPFFFFFRTVPGISCSTWDLLASAFKLLAVTCEIWFSDQGSVPRPCIGSAES